MERCVKKSAFPSIGWKHRAVTYLGEGYEFGEKELFRSEHVVVIMEGDSFRLVVEPGVTQEEVDVAIEKGRIIAAQTSELMARERARKEQLMFAGARANEYARSVMSASYIVAILRHIAANNNPPWWDSYGRMLKTADGGPGGAPGKQCIVAVYENSVWVEVRDFNSHRKDWARLDVPKYNKPDLSRAWLEEIADEVDELNHFIVKIGAISVDATL